jgi:hypothetical protein
MADRAERRRFFESTAVERLNELKALTRRHGGPWFRKQGLEPDALGEIADGWYRGY